MTEATNTWTSRPICCPFCGGGKVVGLDQWSAYSELDSGNEAELTEYQCEGECEGRSFWA